MPRITAKDSATGKTVTFDWNGEGQPTESDMADIFRDAQQRSMPAPDEPGGLSMGKHIAAGSGVNTPEGGPSLLQRLVSNIKNPTPETQLGMDVMPFAQGAIGTGAMESIPAKLPFRSMASGALRTAADWTRSPLKTTASWMRKGADLIGETPGKGPEPPRAGSFTPDDMEMLRKIETNNARIGAREAMPPKASPFEAEFPMGADAGKPVPPKPKLTGQDVLRIQKLMEQGLTPEAAMSRVVESPGMSRFVKIGGMDTK